MNADRLISIMQERHLQHDSDDVVAVHPNDVDDLIERLKEAQREARQSA